jgi:hypothetical protein
MRRACAASAALLFLLCASSFASVRLPAAHARRSSSASSAAPTLWGRLLRLVTSGDGAPKSSTVQTAPSVVPPTYSDSQGGLDPDGKP